MFEFIKKLAKKRVSSKQNNLKSGIVQYASQDDFFEMLCHDEYTRLTDNVDVKTCIDIICNLVSSMTIYLMLNSEQGDVRVTNGFSRILDIEPNKYLTRKKLISKCVEEIIISGNSILLPRYRKGNNFEIVEELLEELQPLDINNIVFFQTDDGGYKIQYNQQYFKSDEVIHFTLQQDTSLPWLGIGMKKVLKDVLKNLKDSGKIRNEYYTKHYKPGIVFSFMADTADFADGLEQKEVIFEKWIQTAPGTPYMLPANIIDFKSFSPLSLQDIAINESVMLDKKTVAAAFGIPSYMLGLGSFDEDEYNNFIDVTISPLVKGMAQELTKKLILSPRYYIKFNLESIKAFKTENKINMMLEAKKQGIFNANEIRIQAGYDPINEPEMNEYNILENYIPISKLADQKKLLQGGESGEQ